MARLHWISVCVGSIDADFVQVATEGVAVSGLARPRAGCDNRAMPRWTEDEAPRQARVVMILGGLCVWRTHWHGPTEWREAHGAGGSSSGGKVLVGEGVGFCVGTTQSFQRGKRPAESFC